MKNIVGVTLCLVGLNANTALVSIDWKTTDDNLLTRDTTSGLNWLDLTETNSMSFEYVSTQFGTGGLFEGFRYARKDEVVELWSKFGVDLSVGAPKTSSGPVDQGIVNASAFLGNIMNEYSDEFSHGLLGVTADVNPYDPEQYYRLGAFYRLSSSVNSYMRDGGGLYNVDSISVEDGSYLVSSVPIPSAVWLFSSGLIGLVGLARRKDNV